MSEDRLPVTGLKSDGGDAARRDAPSVASGESVQSRPRTATMQRTVGVYERPAQRTRLSLPLLVIVILATLISVVLSVRFLF
ncbi:MAG TPA: hypothetical protein VGB76_13210 [Pyrinomonadaceae bacterium]|jgi:hypothetical protein